MEVSLTPHFRRQFKKLPKALKEEALDKIELFSDLKNHSSLKVHKLKGPHSQHLSFSVNYKYRIVFTWEVLNQSAILIAIGDHTIYD